MIGDIESIVNLICLGGELYAGRGCLNGVIARELERWRMLRQLMAILYGGLAMQFVQ